MFKSRVPDPDIHSGWAGRMRHTYEQAARKIIGNDRDCGNQGRKSQTFKLKKSQAFCQLNRRVSAHLKPWLRGSIVR